MCKVLKSDVKIDGSKKILNQVNITPWEYVVFLASSSYVTDCF